MSFGEGNLHERVELLEALVRDMWRGMCGPGHDCRTCGSNCGTYSRPECAFRRRMDELGVVP